MADKEASGGGGCSSVGEWFEGQGLLVTGATGFLGKALVEKILRTCPPRRLFLLVRPKKGLTPARRIENLFQDPVFERLKKERPDFLKKITGVEGDIGVGGLGLGAGAREMLLRETTVVIHGAATVNFNENLRTAIQVNVGGTKEIIDLCKEMKNLKSVVHVSTAYSHCMLSRVEEKFYDSPMEPEALLAIPQHFTQEQLDNITHSLIGKWPNTYVFTKAVAERVVQKHSKNLPIAMFRPAIVVGAWREPVAGWVDNLYGPTGVLVGAGAGVMRTLHADPAARADMVPVDLAVNCLLAVARETALPSRESGVKIYNFVTSKRNPVTWGRFLDLCKKHGCNTPTSKAIYYYTFTLTPNRWLFAFYKLLFHILPALLVDGFMTLTRQNMRLMPVYKKIDKFSKVISEFSCRSWDFNNDNTLQMLSNLGPDDRKSFDFDMSTLDWDEFFANNISAIRIYIFGETADSLKSAKLRFIWLWLLHRFIQLAALSITFWCCYSIYSSHLIPHNLPNSTTL